MDKPVEKSLSWIYDPTSGAPKSEDYLLGKAVDANFERGTLGQINAVEYDCTPESIFSSKAEHQVDLQRKLQEDPLIALKKKELDVRKRVLDNPIKMKQLQEYIKKSKKSKKTKKEKKKKRKKCSSSNSESDSDLDALLLKKLRQSVQQQSDDEGASSGGKSTKHFHDSTDMSTDKKGRRSRGLRRKSRSRSPPRRDTLLPRSSRSSRSPRRDKHSDTKFPHRSQQDSRSPRRDRHSGSKPGTSFEKGKKSLDASEKEKRLKEMMDNAKWRDDQRSKNVDWHKKKDYKEEKEHYGRDHDPEFIRSQLLKAAEVGTVEKRIQSNKHNIQRSALNMEKNFAKR